jgi:hypothetical protein
MNIWIKKLNHDYQDRDMNIDELIGYLKCLKDLDSKDITINIEVKEAEL